VNVSDLTESQHLASNDYVVGTVFPLMPIIKVVKETVIAPGQAKKQSKGVIYLDGAPKGWVANKTELRKIAQLLGVSTNIDKTWIGALLSIKVVGNVRRPDGTTGNAFRVEHAAWPADETNTQQSEER
jgi:hypothetical protein